MIYQVFRSFQILAANLQVTQKLQTAAILIHAMRNIRGSSILEFYQTSGFGMLPPLRPAALLTLPLLLLASCTGYHLGNTKPAALAHVKSIAVPMFTNDTQHPKAEVLATSAVSSALSQDGTFRLTSREHADAILNGCLRNISYSAIRGSRFDTVHPEELTNTVTLTWSLSDAKNPSHIFVFGTSTGISQLFVDPDLQTARNNALPDSLERAAEALVSRLANGF